MRVIVEIVGDTADVHPLNYTDRERVASVLLAAAGDRRREVRTITGRTGAGFAAPVEIVRAAGLIAAEAAPEPGAAPEPVKPARKPRTKTAKTEAES